MNQTPKQDPSCEARHYNPEQDRFTCQIDGNGCSCMYKYDCHKYLREFGNSSIPPENRLELNVGWSGKW